MNFRSGFNFFKQATRMFQAPSVPFAKYSNNMQKVVNKALISESSRALQLVSLNHLLTIHNISELLQKCEEKALSDEAISTMQGMVSVDKVITCLRSGITTAQQANTQ